jgi:hypothetical protein
MEKKRPKFAKILKILIAIAQFWWQISVGSQEYRRILFCFFFGNIFHILKYFYFHI